jgi:hypothetical protein
MSLTISGSYFFVQPGEKCYKVASNYTNYLQLGVKGVTKYYFESKIVDDEFLISATLLDKEGKVACELSNNFITEGKGCTKEMLPNGYRVLDKSREKIFEILVSEKNICELKGPIYDGDGNLIAKDENGNYLVFRGPAIIGRSDGAIGIKID